MPLDALSIILLVSAYYLYNTYNNIEITSEYDVSKLNSSNNEEDKQVDELFEEDDDFEEDEDDFEEDTNADEYEDDEEEMDAVDRFLNSKF